MSAGYTPGPWQCLPGEADKPYLRVRGMRLGGRYKIANVHSPAYEGAGDREAGETRANALLIAQAPEMLELLSRIVAADDAHALDQEHIEAARALLAKARPTPGEGA